MVKPSNRYSRRLFQMAIVLLCLQAVLTYGLDRIEYLPSPPPLDQFPSAVGAWQRLQDGIVEPDVLDMLAPDDILNRFYVDSASHQMSLFIAYYKSQHRVKIAHDPKVCLPGTGWAAQISKVIDVPTTVTPQPIPVNYYVVEKGDAKRVVLYWFQTHKRAITHGQILRAYRVLDTISDNRTDMALVRVLTPIYPDGLQAATDRAITFVQAAYPFLLPYFPPKSSH